MGKIFNKIITLCLVTVFSICSFAGCVEEKPSKLLPEYSARVPFETFAYGATSSGTFNIDGEPVKFGDYLTAEKIKEYKDAGFNVMYITNQGFLPTQLWEESQAKKIMDLCVEVGIDKVILTDFYVRDLALETNLVGEGSTFKIDSTNFTKPEYDGDNRTKEERALDAYIWDRMKIYADHPTFYGLNMYDEPSWERAESLGKVYKSIRRISKIHDLGYLYIQTNLGPIGFYTDFLMDYTETEDGKFVDKDGNEIDFEAAYRNYLRSYLIETDADRICVDIYAFRRTGLWAGHFQTLQIMEEVCQEFGVDWTLVLQSFQSFKGTVEAHSKVSKSEMMWEANTGLGFGATNYAYYTYYTSSNYSTSGDKWGEEGSFLNMNGEKNEIYYYGQYVLDYLKKFHDVISNYEYQGAKFFRVDGVSTFDLSSYFSSVVDTVTGTTVPFDNSHEFELVKGVEYDNEIVLLSELKDENNDLYMYMVQNVIDPRNAKIGDTDLNVTVDFGDYKWVAEYDCGNLRYVKLDNGKYNTSLSAGYAKFVIPLE